MILREQITLAKSALPTCSYPNNTKIEFFSILTRAERELILNENYTGSKTLYDGVRQDITRCVPQPQEPDVIPTQPSFGFQTSPVLVVVIATIVIPAIVAIWFGIKWYETSKEESQERR